MLKIKEAPKVAVRIPEWTTGELVTCNVNGAKRQHTWSGGYAEVDGLMACDSVAVEFPMRQKTMFSVIGDNPFKLTIKGNTVVDIDPQGETSPLCQRQQYMADKAPMKTVTSFVSRKTITLVAR